MKYEYICKMKYISVFILGFLFLSVLQSCQKDEEEPPGSDNGNNVPGTTTPLPTNVPDGDFENWKSFTTGENTYYEPASGWWATLNILSNIGSPQTAVRTTDVNTGKYAAKLTTGLWGQLVMPGILLSGVFDFNAPNMVIEGQPFTEKPEKFRGYYKYTSVDGDSAAVFASITRYNTVEMKRDTIAEASFAVLTTVEEYTYFDLDFTYYLTDVEPDTINIVFSSSADGANFNGAIGSTLYIDDISLLMQDSTKVKLLFE